MDTKYVDTVTHVSVEWILKNVTSSVDGFTFCADHGYSLWGCTPACDVQVDWESMIEEKFWDSDDEFLNDVLTNGIKKPICLRHREDGWSQGNGHHRLAIAILSANDSVPVVFSFDHQEYMMCWLTT